ncbi:MAG: acyl-ACP--UDP-N-acetylglucosamine O-acyltransferase [Coxiellaceae bacterium]|nr:MAG: acyl-ACP--UDP-N-acetylglucosamine O-acyltransferase [Coxiellaceae bacterium]
MIDNQAIIDPSAKIADGVVIGPWSIIGPNVEIGAGTWIGPHVVIKSNTRIGNNNKIYQFASVGEDPQHLGYKGEPTRLEIGNNNLIREFTTINRGTVQGHGVTRIGNNNLFMSYVHVAHDCNIGNNTIFVNNASLAGHVTVDDYAYIGGFVGVHQFCSIGAYSFLSKAALVGKDVLPYVIVSDNLATVHGLNLVGLKRNGFSIEAIRKLRNAYNIIYRRGLTVPEAIGELEKMVLDCPEIQRLIDALRRATRGIIR